MLPPYIIKTNLLSKNTLGITLFPFVLINKNYYETVLKNDPERYKVLINHETIHIHQQVECLVLPFYILYGLSYLINMRKYTSGWDAYRFIWFEKEAYDNENNLDYLKNRKWFAWMRN